MNNLWLATDMNLPKQAAPVIRPDIIHPHSTFNVRDASTDRIGYIKFDVLHGANYNDPMRFVAENALPGCHILSGYSREVCLATYRYFSLF